MNIGTETAAICGLFCGTCPSYPNECEGCLSQKVAADCQSCGSGFRDCAKQHQVTRCYECADFPCKRLTEFSTKHIVNNICHHKYIIDNLNKMKTIGTHEWVKQQAEINTCPSCNQIKQWFEPTCPRCKLVPGKYRHFKGKEYELLYVAKHSETLEEMVVYRALYGEGGVWVRPAAMWHQTVNVNGVDCQRFTLISV